MTHSKLYKYTGHLYYTFNLFDEHEKAIEFEILWGSPLTYNELKSKVAEDYNKQLGIAQCINSIVYSREIILMEGK